MTDNEIIQDIEVILQESISKDYIQPILNSISSDVIDDIKTSSNFPNYNDYDIMLALGRVLQSKLAELDTLKNVAS